MGCIYIMLMQMILSCSAPFSIPLGCQSYQYTCDNGACIPYYWACDGVYDCPDRSDEFYCGKDRTKWSQFKFMW